MARFVLEYHRDNQDEPDRFLIIDTAKQDRVVARVEVPDYQKMSPATLGSVLELRSYLKAAWEALVMAERLTHYLEDTAEV